MAHTLGLSASFSQKEEKWSFGMSDFENFHH